MDAAKNAVILRATQEILAQVGYEQLTIEAVAARARASKNTIYRRWPSKPELVTAAILALRPESPFPDSGSLRGDVRAAVLCYGGLDEFGVEVMLSVTVARRHHEDLARRIDAEFHSWTRSVGREVFERAATRGEIGEEEVPILALVLGALTFHRQVAVQRPSDETYADFVADRVLLPLAAALRTPPAVPTDVPAGSRRRPRRRGDQG
jgi:AcrR family transcriptional regulator